MPINNPSNVNLKDLRISFHTDNGIVPPTSDVTKTIIKAASELEKLGIMIDQRCPKAIKDSQGLLMSLVLADGGESIRDILQKVGTKEHTFPWLDNAKPLSMKQFHNLINKWDTFRINMTSFMENYDIILSPVNTSPAIPFSEISSQERGFSYTQTYNLTGWPCVVVRGGTSKDGLPIGIQIISRPWHEDVALAVAKYLETVMCGFQQPFNI